MSKELVISATSHERRVAILEEGQLVEIYIEREKEFALVGSIYKGRVTRVLPGMQSAFVDIGLDGDAFLYVSDVFENLEDYDHGHGHEPTPAITHGEPPSSSEHIELPGEMLAHAHEAPAAESLSEESHGDSEQHDVHTHVEESEPGAPGVDEAQHTSEEERQPDSNESAPQNFAPRYNPTQYRPSPSYSPRGASDRGGDRTEAAIAAAVTAVATGHNLADAAAEDVLGVAAVAADAVVVAVAADTARVARAICLRPSMLPRRVANLAVGIAARSVVLVVEDIRSAAGTIIVALGVTSITAATLRALPRHPLLRTRRKSRSFCRVNHSPNIVGVPCRNRLRQLLSWNRNASNRRPTRMNRSHGLLVSPLLPMLRAVRVAVCPAGCWLALPRKELNQPSRTNR